eukprot:3017071-Prymnesium_polylepis.2
MANWCTASLTGSAQKVPMRRLRKLCSLRISWPPGIVISMRRKVEPAFRMVTFSRATVAANRSGGETGEPSSRMEGTRHSSDAAIMYDWPVIQPGVAITSMTSLSGRTSKTVRVVRHRPTW